MRPIVHVGAALVASAAIAGSLFYVRQTSRELDVRADFSTTPYATSSACASCHPHHYASWHRTFHRTMTQEATPAAVVGDFTGATLSFEGVTSTFTREGDAFFIETQASDGSMKRFPIVRTVGSRRVQQYVTRVDDRHIRLPLAWNIEEKRWFHLNGGFLNPDGSDFQTHTALWDANCIFCHNTGPNPRYDWNAKAFDSKVEELGIACEACHGPGAEHIEVNRNPLRRYLLHYSDRDDRTIVNPRRLPKLQQVQVCGHCHGQRLPKPLDRINDFLTYGDPYRPGDDLSTFTEPMTHDTELQGLDITLRFWRDGTPRLTAYEYQGLMMSKDFQHGELTCISCHSAHSGDPRGMIEERMRGAAACEPCHAKLVKESSQHSRHRADGSGNDCYACHMPKITYGLLEVHPTHRIQSPDPSRAWKHEMPEACTLCHTNRSAKWAATEIARMYAKAPAELPQSGDFAMAENVRALLAGDVLQRSVAVMAMGEEKSAFATPLEQMWVVPFLLTTMEDSYPAVRLFAWRSLRELVARAAPDPRFDRLLERMPRFDFEGTKAERDAALGEWRKWWQTLDKRGLREPGSEVPLDAAMQLREDVVRELKAKQQSRAISIGE